MNLLPVRSACLLLPLAFVMPLSAHEPAETAGAVRLDPVIVHFDPLRANADEVVRPISVLSGEALARSRQGTLGDLLLEQPGVSSGSFGPGVGRPVIRGQGGARVLVLDNGINTMDASSISSDHAVSLDALFADQVEIIKGPAALLFGGAAAAGVVNVVDDRLADRVIPGFRLRGDLSYGSNADETTTALRARYGIGQWQFGADLALRDAGDFEIPGYGVRLTEAQVAGGVGEHDHDHGEGHDHGDEFVPFGRLDNSHLDARSLGGSLAWVGERASAALAVSRFETNYGIPPSGQSHAHDHDGHDHGDGGDAHHHDGVRIDLRRTRIDGRGVLHEPFTGLERAELRVGVNEYTHDEVHEDGSIGTTFDVSEHELRLEAVHLPLAGWVGAVGVQYNDRDFLAVGAEAFVPPVQTRNLGLFVVEHRDVGPFHLELGARIDQVRHSVRDPGGIPTGRLVDTDFSPLSLSAGLVYALDEAHTLRLNAHRAQRAPAAEELYAFGAHLATGSFERGHLDLKRETANHVELSLHREHGRLTGSLTAFHTRYSDYIYLQEVDAGLNADGSGLGRQDGRPDRVSESGRFSTDGELLLVDFAQDDAVFYGAEAEAKLQLIKNGDLRFSLTGLADFVRAERRDGSPLPRIPPVRLGVGGELVMGPLSGSLRYLRAQKQDRSGTLETWTPGYDLLSADLSWRLPVTGGHGATVYLRGRNLLDEKVRLSTSFLKDTAPLPGRSVFVGLRFTFDRQP